MKRTIRLMIMMAVLLAGATGALSQESGTLKNGYAIFTYSFSGGAVISSGESHPGIQRAYTCETTPGSTIIISCKGANKDKGKILPCHIRFTCYSADGNYLNSKILHSESLTDKNASYSYTVPKNAGRIEITANCPTGTSLPCTVFVTFKVVKKPTTTTPTPTPPPSNPADDCNCDYIRSDIGYNIIDSHIRFNDFYGEVKMRPNWLEDDSYEFVDIDSPIYECYRIKTEEDSGAILGLEDMSTYVIKPESILIIRTEEDNTSRFELIVGTLWGNVKKMIRGESIECEMSQCVSGISGTIVAWEEKNGVSSVYLFAGKVDVTSKKTKKKQVLQPGQTTSVGKDGKIVVKKFNIEQGAKKFGIPMSEIRNHYSNTTTTATTKRYNVERAMVKYKVTTGTTQGVMAKVFDKYGQQERRELKMGNQTTLQLTQGNNSYSLDTQAKTYTQVTNAELNFLNMNDPVMLKLKLKKKGTAKVLNRECTIYANSDTEFYVWKGIVLKKVAHTKKGITTTEATSVELPASVDTKYFNMPTGYRKK